MVHHKVKDVISNANFHRPDSSQKLYELIRIFPGWEKARIMPQGYHRHLFYELLWLKSGSWVQMADFKEYVIIANQVLFLPKNVIHYCQEGQLAEGILLLFKEDFFSTDQAVAFHDFMLFNPLGGPLLLTPASTDEKVLNNLFSLLLEDTSEPISFGQSLSQQSLLYVLLYKIEQIAQHSAGKTETPSVINLDVYSRFSVLLERNFRTQHTVNFYASALHLSPKQLARNLFISSGGSTTQQLIHTRLIVEAKRLLAYSTLSVKEVAYTIGLEDPAYFSRLFKRKTGSSPDTFRAMWTQKSY